MGDAGVLTATWQGAALVGVVAPFLAAAERLNPATALLPATAAVRRRRRVVALAFAVSQLLWVPVVIVVLVQVVDAVSPHGVLRRAVAGEPAALRAAEAFLLMDVVAYWTHRGEHAVHLLWRLHSVHHGGAAVDWLTSLRFHPLDVLLEQGLPVTVAALLGFPLAPLGPYLAVVTVVTLLAHVNTVVPDRWLAKVVVTPGYHRAHHEPAGNGGRFALVLPVLDVLFGTAGAQRKTSSPARKEAALAT